MSGFRTARVSEIPLVDDGRAPFRTVRHHLGIKAFGVNAFVAPEAGGRVVNEHDEEGGDEELYVVLSGHATFTIDGDEVDAPRGTLVFVLPEAQRSAVAREAGTIVLAVGATAGRAFVASGWELWAPAMRHYEAREYERAIEILTGVLERHPDPGVLYNLACCESLAGRADDAIEHLQRALSLDGGMSALAGTDPDLDAIRDDPRFPA